MSEVEYDFFAELLLCTWWLHFQENIFSLGPKSVIVSAATPELASYLLTLFYFSCYFLEKKDFVLADIMF